MDSSVIKPRNELIRSQVEYYFGDINLNKNGFLKQRSEENNGWVCISDILRFKRLKKITTDPMDIIEAIDGRSDLLEVSADHERIRRRDDHPLPPRSELISDLKKRSVAITGFPFNVSVGQVLAFLNEYGNVPSVVMLREEGENHHNFKGKVLATFDDQKAASDFLLNHSDILFHGSKLYSMMQHDFEKELKAFLESTEQNPSCTIF